MRFIKRLYNHTAWRRRKIWDGAAMVSAGDSVEEKAIEWGIAKGIAGTGSTSESTKAAEMIERIKNFAEPNNRRTVYILELDKDPTTSSSVFNPVEGTALLDANTPTDI
jgi:enoyl-[acyl-carrier-protein] reductase (NADH)